MPLAMSCRHLLWHQGMSPTQVSLHIYANACISLFGYKCKQIISGAGQRPAMSTYMSDGWSSLVRTYLSDTICGVKSLRVLRQKHEFLNERSNIKTYDRQGRIVCAQMIEAWTPQQKFDADFMSFNPMGMSMGMPTCMACSSVVCQLPWACPSVCS